MAAIFHARCWAELDRAERLAESGTLDGYDRAIVAAASVLRAAERAREGHAGSSAWDESAWALCTVVMTRASVLLLRFRQRHGMLREWSGRGSGRPMERDQPPDEASEGQAESSSSGVRARTGSIACRLLVVEPDAACRADLVEQARSVDVQLRAAASVDEAAAIRSSDRAEVVACHFPMAGAARLVDALYRERSPVIVLTDDVLHAIATFGFDVPILARPLTLIQILEQAHELAARPERPAVRERAAGARLEISPPVNRRDRRRE